MIFKIMKPQSARVNPEFQAKARLVQKKFPKKCLTLGFCLEYETFIRGVFCPNLFVCLCVFVCPFFLKKINNC